METWHIHIRGQVQGVGFRPFVFSLAKKYGLNGWVNNTSDGVHIEINSDEKAAELFFEEIKKQPPVLSRITHSHISKTEKKFFDKFQIVHSESSDNADLLLTPDSAICPDCLAELYDLENRRSEYPFTTCTNCGPRYSIVNRLPYDRGNTTMDEFRMCPECKSEYGNPIDRRFYSQTNSCSKCAIELTLFDSQKNRIKKRQDELIDEVINLWREGKIIAIKGIGGYLLTCDARTEATISELRKRKYRPSKPFALMFPNVDSIENMEFGEKEISELKSPVSPIVILEKNDKNTLPKSIAPGLNQIGVMLPYVPLFGLLLKRFGSPIVATSGNMSNSPIVFMDENALNELEGIADYILTNNRKIVVPQDDSVIRFSPFKKKKIIIRRSRGLAPTYINAELKLPEKNILAMGAMLKSSFSFLCNGNVYVSQYLGDLENFETQENYKHTIRHFFQLFNSQPENILIDKHPEYASTQYGHELAEKTNAKIDAVQHHISHFGAILGEHNLVNANEPILGVIWDGTGLGDDGKIWGGEFFQYENYGFTRINHFEYFDFILGDKMPKEPRISALSICRNMPESENVLKNKFTKTEWSIYSKLLKKESGLKTSSVGRIFDAVASLLGIMDKQTYEGEAAMRLENMAMSYFKKNGLTISESYFQAETDGDRISTKNIISGIISDIVGGEEVEMIAAKFHFTLVEIIEKIVEKSGAQKIAFSGGVFQNGVLVDLVEHHLSPKFDLYFHEQLSPNDENISFGQLICHHIKNIKSCV